MFKKTPLATAVSSITLAAATGGVALPATAEDERLVEEIIVTGSRIKRADIASASPISVIERKDMVFTGMTDVGDLLQSMPSMSGSPIGTTTNNGGNGSVRIDLRGMGPSRTLTLINGQRMVDQGDFQTVPLTWIERVEILKDGASAIYGADAVAGVVNIITRTDFEGFEVYGQTADWDESAGLQNSSGFIAGKQFDGGRFMFGAEYVDQEQAYQRDTPWSFMQDSYYIYPEGCEAQVSAPYTGAATGGCYPIGSSRIPESRLTFMNQGTFLIGTPATTPYEVGMMEDHDGRTYNYAPVNYLQTPYERTNLFAEGAFELSDNVRFYARVRGNKRLSEQELAPMPFTGGDPMYDGSFDDDGDPLTASIPYTGVSENNYYLRRAVDAFNTANAADIAAGDVTALVYEPLVNPRRRMIETTRGFTQDISMYEWVARLEGEFRNVSWEVYMNEGYGNGTFNDVGQFSGVRLTNAMGPSADLDGNGQPECYGDVADAGTLIVGCVPLNMFGGGVVSANGNLVTGTLTQDMVDYVAVNITDAYILKQSTAGASLTGDAFELPGGELGWALGYSYWRQEFEYAPDSAKTIGAVTGNVGAGTTGSLSNNAVYAEILAPVMDNGTQALLLKAGIRYDDWDAFDSDTTWQLGVEFNVVDDLKLRATAGTIYRAPTVGDLFGGLVDSFPTFTDPCDPPAGVAQAAGCTGTPPAGGDSQVHALVGGNPNLVPETGDSLTAGLVWTPTFGDHDLSLTIDYWELDLEDGISSLGVDFILEDCYVSGNAGSCGLITRAADYSIDVMLDASLNVAEQGAQGIDTEARWTYQTDFGEFEASFLWSHILERTKTAFPGATKEDLSGRYTDPTAQDGGAYAEDKLNYTVLWNWNDLTVVYKGEFISGMDADTWCNCGAGNQADGSYIQDIDSELYHDLIVSYDAPWGINLTGGIVNFTDEPPPFIEVGFNATTDVATYRLFGRGYYLRLGWTL
jgi:outer membrane receptor protein involved in Fe transport|tara:strand:- start:31912 stop:34833 length:2922 start_codon:yes stop_codon:yes gene_type:complete